jgi:hypothetical protein
LQLKQAKEAKKNGKRREWTNADIKELKAHSKARTPVAKISKTTKRTVGALNRSSLATATRHRCFLAAARAALS